MEAGTQTNVITLILILQLSGLKTLNRATKIFQVSTEDQNPSFFLVK